ncbi:MAG: hypothetical protein QXK07_06035, partial [Desulfurococcaceae archaeon]
VSGKLVARVFPYSFLLFTEPFLETSPRVKSRRRGIGCNQLLFVSRVVLRIDNLVVLQGKPSCNIL